MKSGGQITATASYKTGTCQSLKEDGMEETMTTRDGYVSVGKVSIAWDANWPPGPLSADDKRAWLSRFIVVVQSTSTPDSGAPVTTTEQCKPLLDFVDQKDWSFTDMAAIQLRPSRADGITNEKTLTLLPIDIVAVFGFGGTGKDSTKAYLEGAATSKSGNVYVVKGKAPGGGEKNYTVLLGESQASLQQGLSTAGCFVVYDGHANMGMGPSFTTGITSLSDFMNTGNPQAAINLPYWNGHDYQSLTVSSSEIASSPVNYDVPSLDKPSEKRRYPNNEGVMAGGKFTLTDTSAWYNLWNGIKYHHTRGTGGAKFLIVNAGAADLPSINYDTFFFNACNTGRDFMEVFNKGNYIYTTDESWSVDTSRAFVEAIIDGKRGAQVLKPIKDSQDKAEGDIYRLISR